MGAARIDFRVDGEKITHLIATLDGVQDYLDEQTFEMAVRAEEGLIEHRQQGHASIDVMHGEVDWYVVLNDERGQKAALSIEYGREGYIDEDGVEWGSMEGLYILHTAAQIPKKKKPVRDKKRRSRPGRGTDGRFSGRST